MKRRMIDPDFFSDSLIIQTLDYPGRIFYVGLWVVAEDSGVFEPDILGLKMKLFPGDVIDVDQINNYYETLKGVRKIVEFEHDGRRYAWIKNFFKHQHLEKPNPPTLPLPKCIKWYGREELNDDNRRHWKYEITATCPPCGGTMAEHGRNDDGTVTPICCPCSALKERKGKKRKGNGKEVNGKENKGKGTRAPEAADPQPVPPAEEAARLTDLNEKNRRREELTRQFATGEITLEQYERECAAVSVLAGNVPPEKEEVA